MSAISNHITSGVGEQLKLELLGYSTNILAFDPDTMIDTVLLHEQIQYQSLDYDYVYANSFHLTVKQSYAQAILIEKAQVSMTSYKEWRGKILADIEGMLKHYFPDRWEIKDIGTASFDSATSVISSFGMYGFDMKRLPLYNTLYNVYVHFPEIVITNSKGYMMTLKDMYIRFDLSWKMAVQNMMGFRATKTPEEYRLNYSHSHMHTTNGWSSFCLGSTGFDTLMAELRLGYDEMKVELFFQTLTDYLSWESLEGGPHITMSTVLHPTNRGVAIPVLPEQTIIDVYDKFVENKTNVSYSVAIDPRGTITVTIPRSMALLKSVTSITPDEFKFPISSEMKSIYPPNAPINIGNIADINARASCQFTFKGKEVSLKIVEDVEEEKADELGIDKYADSRLVEYVAKTLSDDIRMYLHNKFWYGTSKKSRDTTKS